MPESSRRARLTSGGTALRLIYGSPRFSEDLDFSSSLLRVKPIETAALEALNAIGKEGIKTAIEESKITAGGYLGVFSFTLAGAAVRLQLEISSRDKQVMGEPVTIAGDFLPAYTVVILKQEQLIAQKIRALQMRQKPRDWYDLYFILRANLLPVAKRRILSQLGEKLKNSRIDFTGELKLFLPQSHWLVVKNFKSVIEREIKKYGAEI
ncbi:nucleotidyl transferase AbiEii/AbiGii toxin family protein [Patescibacteria group bacterium]|nr:nucleotidyl transferase AbiEii/AbiGii toxin family protein [Patescibacteria group bacterium]